MDCTAGLRDGTARLPEPSEVQMSERKGKEVSDVCRVHPARQGGVSKKGPPEHRASSVLRQVIQF